MKPLKAIVALLFALALLLPLALAEADAARFEELVAANSMEARFERHGNMQVLKSYYYEDGSVKTDRHIIDPVSHYYTSQYGYSAYLRPDLFIRNDSNDPTDIIEYIYDSEEACYDNFAGSFKGWSLGVTDEALMEINEANGVVTARTTVTDPATVDARLALYQNVPECYAYGKGMALAYDYTFDAETGDLLKAVETLVDAGGNDHIIDVDEYTYGIEAFDPAAEDSPFAYYFAAPDGRVTLTLHFMDDGTEVVHTMPHGIYFIIVHGDDPVDYYLDEACTQPYEGGNQLDALTLYVK